MLPVFSSTYLQVCWYPFEHRHCHLSKSLLARDPSNHHFNVPTLSVLLLARDLGPITKNGLVKFNKLNVAYLGSLYYGHIIKRKVILRTVLEGTVDGRKSRERRRLEIIDDVKSISYRRTEKKKCPGTQRVGDVSGVRVLPIVRTSHHDEKAKNKVEVTGILERNININKWFCKVSSL